MTTAFIQKNDSTSKFELIIDNKVFRKSSLEHYLFMNLDEYKNFKDLDVEEIIMSNGSKYVINGDSEVKDDTIKKTEKIKFDVNKRYEFMEKIIKMVILKKSKSAICVGQGGLGKTHTVLQTLSEMDLTEENGGYVIVKGYSTAKGLYRTLYENRHNNIIFDDCDSILKDSTARNLLKGALDSYDKREISWNSEAWGDDLPKKFNFRGSVIFISNLTLPKFDQALLTRSMVIDLSMTKSDVVERMEFILEDIMPDVDMRIKTKALGFIKENIDRIADINFRTLMKAINVVDTFEDEEWSDLCLYSMQN